MKSPFAEKSYAFAVKIVFACDSIAESKREYILTKQLIRSGTAISALYQESRHAESRADFIHKLSIALNECNESIFWINLQFDTGKMPPEKHTALLEDATQLLKMLTAMIITSKKRPKRKPDSQICHLNTTLNLSPITYHLSPITYHLSPVTSPPYLRHTINFDDNAGIQYHRRPIRQPRVRLCFQAIERPRAGATHRANGIQ